MYSDAGWSGWRVADGGPCIDSSWQPWVTVLDDADAPVLRWYSGGLTNAAFNELDPPILQGRGETTAFIFEPGGLVRTRGSLLLDAILFARALLDPALLALEAGP